MGHNRGGGEPASVRFQMPLAGLLNGVGYVEYVLEYSTRTITYILILYILYTQYRYHLAGLSCRPPPPPPQSPEVGKVGKEVLE